MRRLLHVLFAVFMVLGAVGSELHREEPATCCCTGEPVAPLAPACPCGMPVQPNSPCRGGATDAVVAPAPSKLAPATQAQPARPEPESRADLGLSRAGNAAAQRLLRVQALATGSPDPPLLFLAWIGTFRN